MANTVDPDQTVPIGSVCSGYTLFASILNLSVMLGNYLQQTTSADNIFKCFFGELYGLTLFQSYQQLHEKPACGICTKYHINHNPGDKNISILHLSCRTSDLQFSLVLQTNALVL